MSVGRYLESIPSRPFTKMEPYCDNKAMPTLSASQNSMPRWATQVPRRSYTKHILVVTCGVLLLTAGFFLSHSFRPPLQSSNLVTTEISAIQISPTATIDSESLLKANWTVGGYDEIDCKGNSLLNEKDSTIPGCLRSNGSVVMSSVTFYSLPVGYWGICFYGDAECKGKPACKDAIRAEGCYPIKDWKIVAVNVLKMPDHGPFYCKGWVEEGCEE
ncbi:hypothetical protein N431DRAFT_440897 [Stipitochalara longipes BDJ]|nr:hypothetical protein N431DRAFT_440897 [Stipitochalara longipes BDJ]